MSNPTSTEILTNSCGSINASNAAGADGVVGKSSNALNVAGADGVFGKSSNALNAAGADEVVGELRACACAAPAAPDVRLASLHGWHCGDG